MSFHVLVLAGGSGTRLWPMSRRSTPKHLLPLAPGGLTLLRATVDRVAGIADTVSVVTAADQAALCRDEIDGTGADVIAEPEARGTGPALALATRLIAQRDPGAVIASVHADHYVGDNQGYRDAVIASAGWAIATGGLATVGLAPNHPATGFGYVRVGEKRDPGAWSAPEGVATDVARRAAGGPAYASLGFTEKPDAELARQFLAGGEHLWNTGLFAWTAETFENELRAADLVLADAVTAVAESQLSGDDDRAARQYREIRKVAVEPLIFERTPQLTVVKASFPWSDVGSWKDLRDVRLDSGDGDAKGNVTSGEAMLVSSENCMVYSQSGRLVALAGLRDVVVVDTEDAVLVVSADHAQDVKEISERLQESNPKLT